MQSTRDMVFSFVLALLLGSVALPALADEGCLDFKWDVSKERALFAGTPTTVAAGKDAASAPLVAPNHLYKLRLTAQGSVTFAASPGKKTPVGTAFAGLAALKIPSPGSYRIAVDLPIWIDVVSKRNLDSGQEFRRAARLQRPAQNSGVRLEFGAAVCVAVQQCGLRQHIAHRHCVAAAQILRRAVQWSRPMLPP